MSWVGVTRVGHGSGYCAGAGAGQLYEFQIPVQVSGPTAPHSDTCNKILTTIYVQGSDMEIKHGVPGRLGLMNGKETNLGNGEHTENFHHHVTSTKTCRETDNQSKGHP